MVILFGGAAYFTGRLYGRTGMIAVIAGFLIVLAGLDVYKRQGLRRPRFSFFRFKCQTAK